MNNDYYLFQVELQKRYAGFFRIYFIPRFKGAGVCIESSVFGTEFYETMKPISSKLKTLLGSDLEYKNLINKNPIYQTSI